MFKQYYYLKEDTTQQFQIVEVTKENIDIINNWIKQFSMEGELQVLLSKEEMYIEVNPEFYCGKDLNSVVKCMVPDKRFTTYLARDLDTNIISIEKDISAYMPFHYLIKHFMYDLGNKEEAMLKSPYYELATYIDYTLPPSSEKNQALRKLLESLDCVLRSACVSPASK